MSRRNFDKDSPEWKMIGDFWELVKSDWDIDIDDGDKYWDKLKNDCMKFQKAHEHIPFAMKLACAYLDEQKRKESVLKSTKNIPLS